MREPAKMQQIGFIGLGRMGSPMASNLCKKGFELLVYDVNPQALAAFEQPHSKTASSIADIARGCDVVITMLPGSAQVEAVVLGAEGLLAHGRAGQLILDMSTIDPNTTDLLAERASKKGISVVDAPVGRLASHADRGESLFMVGASARDFERVLPLLQAMGTTINHCGKVGTGMRTKLVNNYLAIVSCQLNAEALALSQCFGLDLEKTLEVINGTSAFNGQLRMNWSTKVLKGDISAGFTIDLAHKDLSLIMEAANQAKVPLPVAAATREMFSVARAGRYAQSDFSAMIDVLCDLAGIEKPRFAAPGAQSAAPKA
jgi:4-hydroxybutyrate dehydrogenase/sulfolactaldehyde 3-reductase